MRTVPRAHLQTASGPTPLAACADAGAHQFVVPCILGFARQFSALSISNHDKRTALTLTLIARRSRFRAGTRHWRRGIDGQGHVANFVETEQVAETDGGDLAAYVQIRGSIPLCWSQARDTCIPDDACVVECRARAATCTATRRRMLMWCCCVVQSSL